jgi:hypothetical protein
MTGDDGRVLEQILRMAPTAGTIKSFERLVSRYTNQGGGSYSGAARDGTETGVGGGPARVSDAQYAQMSYSEKKAYAEAHEAYGRRGRGTI